ncbi:hypothetical protein NED98_08275 [Sphingomonas sp. MMSM20]|uniref:hypothetical protein n=1 Tax=Sphingomonas lycopersici TaxID=2951807 RepID=UPI002237B428|nr:hypothetical protein [Sphingomonas lycopersici]MCW6530239.1 hypothetical protein [Sphingomonas lycopersici]
MSEPIVAVTIVSHAALQIAAPADAVWQAILNNLLQPDTWQIAGYRFVSLRDAAVPLGGYRLAKEEGGQVVDERIVHVTERDTRARRLSLFSDHLSERNGLSAYATYHARERPTGTYCAIDCHTRVGVEMLKNADITGLIGDLGGQSEAHLRDYLARLKYALERRQIP